MDKSISERIQKMRSISKPGKYIYSNQHCKFYLICKDKTKSFENCISDSDMYISECRFQCAYMHRATGIIPRGDITMNTSNPKITPIDRNPLGEQVYYCPQCKVYYNYYFPNSSIQQDLKQVRCPYCKQEIDPEIVDSYNREVSNWNLKE